MRLKYNISLLFTCAVFFILINVLNFIISFDNIPEIIKFIGVILVVLFIYTIKTEPRKKIKKIQVI
ncbi:MAG TPA: hypothetical protein DEP28_04330 [Bacteroidetes bacterium]|nr:hypothetical protein [Bacteroidota bacterium]HCN36539.1 hypothetical protein [Bacteroidota bacterium]